MKFTFIYLCIFVFRYFIYFKEFGSYNKQVRLVKSRSNSRGSILEDFLGSAGGNNRNPSSTLNLSLTAVLGNTDYDNIQGASPSPSLFQAYHKIHESTCEYYIATLVFLLYRETLHLKSHVYIFCDLLLLVYIVNYKKSILS